MKKNTLFIIFFCNVLFSSLIFAILVVILRKKSPNEDQAICQSCFSTVFHPVFYSIFFVFFGRRVYLTNRDVTLGILI